MKIKYPKEVKQKIKMLDDYEIDEDLEGFDCFHLYPEDKVAFPEGFTSCRFFQLWGFNFTTKTKRNIGRKDGIDICNSYRAPINSIRIFADGSTYIDFAEKVSIGAGSCSVIRKFQTKIQKA